MMVRANTPSFPPSPHTVVFMKGICSTVISSAELLVSHAVGLEVS